GGGRHEITLCATNMTTDANDVITNMYIFGCITRKMSGYGLDTQTPTKASIDTKKNSFITEILTRLVGTPERKREGYTAGGIGVGGGGPYVSIDKTFNIGPRNNSKSFGSRT
ncbi:hypothetical protein ACJX0J_031378, partial [Zea mays]